MENSGEIVILSTFASFFVVIDVRWAHGNLVVKALCYKPEGRGYDIR
jgi:hypothetical protein